MKHEMVLGTIKELKAHAEMMRKFPEMVHADPNQVSVEPGKTGELVWQFTKAGTFDFACLVPGHFEAGMVGKSSGRPLKCARQERHRVGRGAPARCIRGPAAARSCPKCGMALEPVVPSAATRRMGLPHAPGNRPGCAGRLPEVRDGAGAPDGAADERRIRTRRHEPTFLGQRRAHDSPCGGCHGGASAGASACADRHHVDAGLAATGPCHARRPVGRLALLRARLAVGGQPQPEHVHPDRARRRRRVSVQPGRKAVSRVLPGFLPLEGGEVPSTSRPRPSS